MNISTPYFEKINNDENHIPLAKPSITKKEISYVNDAIINGWGDNKNSYIYELEFYSSLILRLYEPISLVKKTFTCF